MSAFTNIIMETRARIAWCGLSFLVTCVICYAYGLELVFCLAKPLVSALTTEPNTALNKIPYFEIFTESTKYAPQAHTSHTFGVTLPFSEKESVLRTLLDQKASNYVQTENPFLKHMEAEFEDYGVRLKTEPASDLCASLTRTQLLSNFIFTNLNNLSATTGSFLVSQMTEAFHTYLKVAGLASLCFCAPMFSYQLWCFWIPSQYKTHRTGFLSIYVFSLVCFIVVLYGAYYYILPLVLHFLCSINTSSCTTLMPLKIMPSLSFYVRFVLRTLCVFGLLSQIPVCFFLFFNFYLDGLMKMQLLKYRTQFLCVCLCVCALLSPPDVWSQFILYVCFYLWIELMLFFVCMCHEKSAILKTRALANNRSSSDNHTGGSV